MEVDTDAELRFPGGADGPDIWDRMEEITMDLTVNESRNDRIARGAVAALALVWALRKKRKFFGRMVGLGVAGYAGGTAATGHCPLYKATGFGTDKA